MVIRPLTADDIGTVVEFYTALFTDWESTRARAVEDVCRDDASAVWVADQQDRAVGFVAIRVGDGEIHMPAVDPDHVPARRTCERAGFTSFPLVQYYRRLDG